ncbi:MAG: hypothetical protein RR144_04450 [Clostridia bacterium]
MKFENEVTVEIDIVIDELRKNLEENGFKVVDEYDIKDIYLINKNTYRNKNYVELLKHCVLIRNIIEKHKETKMITYKYKEYGINNEIVKQGKVDCHIESVREAKELLKAIDYEELIHINDHLIIYANNIDEIAVQLVNNKHIYIEIEEECNYINKKYENIDSMINVFEKYNIPIKSKDYFVKKVEIEMKEILKF